MSHFEWTIPVVTFLFGQLSLLLLEWFRHHQTRKQRRIDSRDDFQRETLLELQDTLEELALEGSTVTMLRERGFRLPGQRKDIRYDDPHAQTVLRADVRLLTLAERVEDEEVRALLGQVDAAWREALDTQETEKATEAMMRLRNLRRQANERIGTLLRSP